MEIGEEIVKKIDSSLRYIKTLRPSSTLVYQVEKKWIILCIKNSKRLLGC
ncbi:hypothetical protein J4411_00915 [Candidatus Pacearchaeota archaeon]|nr:hypothetical protein [uncultured archaeon]MBS3084455.1 hypothetical protein [Candidatus Pacearchaeota archaeon]